MPKSKAHAKRRDTVNKRTRKKIISMRKRQAKQIAGEDTWQSHLK